MVKTRGAGPRLAVLTDSTLIEDEHTVWKNGVSRPVGFDWPVGVAVAHQQASFDAAGAPDAPM